MSRRGKKPAPKITLTEIIEWLENSIEETERSYKSVRDRTVRCRGIDGFEGFFEAKGMYEGKWKAYQAVLEKLIKCKEYNEIQKTPMQKNDAIVKAGWGMLKKMYLLPNNELLFPSWIPAKYLASNANFSPSK